MANTIETMAPDVLLRKIIDGSLTEFEDDTLTVVKSYRLMNLSQLTRLHLPNLTTCEREVFGYLNSLPVLHLDRLTTSGGYLTQYGKTGKIVVLPSLTGVTANELFRQSANLDAIDIGPLVTRLGGDFIYQSRTPVLILRSTTLVAAQAQDSLGYVGGAADGLGGSTIYIPKVLYDHLGDGSASDYYAAANWSAVRPVKNFTFAQIEGSEYEHYYADGTGVHQSVTKSLTHVMCTNSETFIPYNEPFTGALVAEEGYSMTSVIITMGGTNVTSSVYSNGYINIAHVTGDLVITATAS